jgi:hypothetical protein
MGYMNMLINCTRLSAPPLAIAPTLNRGALHRIGRPLYLDERHTNGQWGR